MDNNLIEQLLNNISPEESQRIENRMLLAAKIDDALKAKGWKKSDLVKALGKKNQSEATKWLSGTHNFTSDLLTDLGRALNTNFFNLESATPKSIVYHIVTVSVPTNSSQSCYANDILKGHSYYNRTVSAQN